MTLCVRVRGLAAVRFRMQAVAPPLFQTFGAQNGGVDFVSEMGRQHLNLEGHVLNWTCLSDGYRAVWAGLDAFSAVCFLGRGGRYSLSPELSW